jgi:hypothetical protein
VEVHGFTAKTRRYKLLGFDVLPPSEDTGKKNAE